VKWFFVALAILIVLGALVAIVGSTLPRTHKASRTLTIGHSPGEIWPALMQAIGASSVPVEVVESRPPFRQVTRVTEQEKNFGGTWTIDVRPRPSTTSGGVESTVTITEEGWVANPIFRFVSRFVMGHHATMDAILRSVAKTLNEPASLSGE
jgi:hypothetical protein